jgi:hypothetical protein
MAGKQGFPMGRERSPRRKTSRFRNLHYEKAKMANEKLQQKINALSSETLRWHKKFLESENDKALQMKGAHEEQNFLNFVNEFWATQVQVVAAENIKLRSMLNA